MDQPSLEGVEAKLGRAGEHLDALYSEVREFVSNGDPHELVKHTDQEARTFRVTMKVLKEPDEICWGLLLGDFLHNLSSALDHLVWQLVLLNSRAATRDNHFPIAMRGTQYWCARKNGTPSLRDRALRDVADEHRALIDEAQPYRGGQLAKQHPLAILHDLSNIDKHRFLHPTFIAIEEPGADDFAVISPDESAIAHVKFNTGPLKDGADVLSATFSTSDPNAKVQMKADIPIRIAFGEDWPVKAEALGDPVFKFVNAIVGAFKPLFAP